MAAPGGGTAAGERSASSWWTVPCIRDGSVCADRTKACSPASRVSNPFPATQADQLNSPSQWLFSPKLEFLHLSISFLDLFFILPKSLAIKQFLITAEIFPFSCCELRPELHSLECKILPGERRQQTATRQIKFNRTSI